MSEHTPHENKFNLSLCDEGVVLPSLTTVQRDALVAPDGGTHIYNVTTAQIEWYDLAATTWLPTEKLGASIQWNGWGANYADTSFSAGLAGGEPASYVWSYSLDGAAATVGGITLTDTYTLPDTWHELVVTLTVTSALGNTAAISKTIHYPELIENTLRVAKNGDDALAAVAFRTTATGKAWDQSVPFVTIAAAITAATAGETIRIDSGTYDHAASLTLKTGVDMEFAPNVTLAFSADGIAILGTNINVKVTGRPNLTNSAAAVNSIAVRLNGDSTDASMDLGDIDGFANAVLVTGKGYITGLDWNVGSTSFNGSITLINSIDAYVECRTLTTQGGLICQGYSNNGTPGQGTVKITSKVTASLPVAQAIMASAGFVMLSQAASRTGDYNLYFEAAEMEVSSATTTTHAFWGGCGSAITHAIHAKVGRLTCDANVRAFASEVQTSTDAKSKIFYTGQRIVTANQYLARLWDAHTVGFNSTDNQDGLIVLDVGHVEMSHVNASPIVALSTSNSNVRISVFIKGGAYVNTGGGAGEMTAFAGGGAPASVFFASVKGNFAVPTSPNIDHYGDYELISELSQTI